jgi:transposase
MKYLGIDVSRKTSVFFLSDSDGRCLERGVIENSPAAMAAIVSKHRNDDGLRVALETGNGVFRYARAMRDAGADVWVVDTYQNALIRESRKKTDRIDAKQLCDQLRREMLPPKPVYIPKEEEEALRSMVHLRADIVKRRVATGNQAIRVADRNGYYSQKSGLTYKVHWERLVDKAESWPLADRLEVKALYGRFLLLEEQRREVETEIENLRTTERFIQKAELLKTIPGLGPVNIACILARYGEIGRFSNSRQAVSYGGLSPTMRQSGKSSGLGGPITKSGNALLRAYLTQAALAVIKRGNEHDPLYLWYLQVRRRRGWKKARVALARKLLAVAFGVLKHERAFDPSLLRAELQMTV